MNQSSGSAGQNGGSLRFTVTAERCVEVVLPEVAGGSPLVLPAVVPPSVAMSRNVH